MFNLREAVVDVISFPSSQRGAPHEYAPLALWVNLLEENENEIQTLIKYKHLLDN